MHDVFYTWNDKCTLDGEEWQMQKDSSAVILNN